MDYELEKLDYKLESLVSVYNAIDAAISNLDFVQISLACDVSGVLSTLRECRLAVHVQIIEARKELVRSFRKRNVVEVVKDKKI